MYLSNLILTNFKNYSEARLEFSDKINCFIGNNGVGKTNLLDAIYYLSFTKSYFNNIDLMNVKHGEDFFAIHGTFLRNGGTPDAISCIQKSGQKKIFRINQKEYERLSDHIGLFPCVMVSPYDRDLINEGSETRRRFIDQVISQFDRHYLDFLIRYNRLLEQRNALLKQFSETRRPDRGLLLLLDEQIAPLASNIFQRRREFLLGFIPVFNRYFAIISDGCESVGIRYESQVAEKGYLEQAERAFEKDLAVRYSTCGTHKDDLAFEISDFPVKKYGSQGQQKSYVIALKLAKFEYIRSLVEFKPLLLLDDIFDKLDPLRVQKIIDLVSEDSFGQVFITDTEAWRINRLFEGSSLNHRLFEITSGSVLPVQ